MIYLIAFATLCSTLLGGYFALRLRDRLHLILGFSAGAVVGVAFFDLMPEALELAVNTATETTFAIMALGFGLYLLLDRLIVLHHDHNGERHLHAARGVWSAGTLSFHSMLDGIGVGLAFQASPAIGLIVAAAVLAHDFSDGINTVNAILKNGGSRRAAFKWLCVDALAPVAGIILGSAFAVSETQLAGLLALFAGFFLYIGASDLLPESHHAHPMRWTTVATILGMLFIYVIISLAH
jgi:ZIP family zinc transporter